MGEDVQPKNKRAPNARNARIDMLKQGIEDAKNKGIEISKKKLCALMAIEYGVSETKVLEYLELFKTVDFIRIEGDAIIPL